MPNWCNNNITVSHPDYSKMAALEEAVNEGKFLNFIIPVPEDLHITAGRDGADGSPEQTLLESKEKANIAKYGHANWYDFCVAKWGTKWDVEAYDLAQTDPHTNTLMFGFDSAWSPPIGVYEEMVRQGYTVEATYYEPGMCFVGKVTTEEGELYDDYYEFGGETSATVRDVIGEDLDDEFGISESMAEYEDEERQDAE